MERYHGNTNDSAGSFLEELIMQVDWIGLCSEADPRPLVGLREEGAKHPL